MPTYGYRCKECSFEFEEFQKMSDPALTECPSCKKYSLVRLIAGGAGLVFKGSGFYLTDYKRPSERETKKSTQTKTTKSEPTPETKPPAKPKSDSGTSSPSS